MIIQMYNLGEMTFKRKRKENMDLMRDYMEISKERRKGYFFKKRFFFKKKKNSAQTYNI